MKYEIGQYVINPNMPDWGPGIVLDVAGSVVTVFFRDCSTRPARQIETRHVELEPAGIDGDPILDNLPPYDASNRKVPKRRVTLQDGITAFRRHFPLLFDDPSYIGDRKFGERGYKIKAHEAYHQQLGNGQGRALLEKGDFDELFKRLFAVETLLNLLSPYEKMALNDALQNEAAARSYYSALFDVVEKNRVDEPSFRALISAVDNLPHQEGRGRVATWPVLTEFPYIARPDIHMFLKPEVTRACAERLVFESNYSPKLNWLTYSRLIQLSQMLLEKLKPHGARDNIDVQSFMWVIAKY